MCATPQGTAKLPARSVSSSLTSGALETQRPRPSGHALGPEIHLVRRGHEDERLGEAGGVGGDEAWLWLHGAPLQAHSR